MTMSTALLSTDLGSGWPGMLLPLLVLVPLFSGLVLAASPKLSDDSVRYYSFTGTLITCLLSIVAAFQFNWARPGDFSLASSTTWIGGFGLCFSFGVDSISLWLLLLTTCLMPLVVVGSFTAVNQRVKEFFVWLLLLEAAMVGVFVATDLIFFYICFEFTLIPLYFLIGIFGSDQRLRAARVFFLYTFTGSMLTFAGLLYVAWYNAQFIDLDGRWSFSIAQLTVAARDMPASNQSWIFLAMLAGFAVKIPLFPVHTWVPLAHTEAPTAVSVVLAGVLLKLGTYAMLRFAIPMTPLAVGFYTPIIGVFAVMGILYTALICWVQTDIKKLIAYSSVSHLGFCVLGMFALNLEGMAGSVLCMINHGLSTGALFLCVGMIYERFHTRQMSQMGGLARVMPVWAFFMVFFCLASVGLPGLNGFVGEFLTLLGTYMATDRLGPAYAVTAAVGMIFGAIYILYMVGRVVFGPVKIPHSDGGHPPRDLGPREIGILSLLAVGCLWLGLWPTGVLRSLDPPLTRLVQATLDPAANTVLYRDPAIGPAPTMGKR